MTKQAVLCWAAISAVSSLSCTSHPLAPVPPRLEAQAGITYEANPTRQLDLLFLIDNSQSMAEEQMNLSRNLPVFMRELEKIEGGLPDLHAAVVSSDFGAGGLVADTCRPLGDLGKFQVKTGCGFDPAMAGARFLATDGRGGKNFTGDLGDVFACMAKLGASGCGYEHQLQAIRGALSNQINPDNRGFLRPEAHLGIILLTDEDDCSAEPDATLFEAEYPGQSTSLRCNTAGHLCGGRRVPAEVFSASLASCQPYQRDNTAEKQTQLINVEDFVAFIKGLKPGRPDKILASAVMGWDSRADAQYRIDLMAKNDIAGMRTELGVAPACSNAQNGVAAPAVRVKAFVDAFAENGSWHDICASDFSPAMAAIGKELAARLNNSCIQAPLVDSDAVADGVQADCQVVDRRPRGDGRAGFDEIPLAACAGGPMPCWELARDPACGSGYRMVVRRPPDMPAAPGTLHEARCLTCAAEAESPRCARPL
jgi:hypothetical protein